MFVREDGKYREDWKLEGLKRRKVKIVVFLHECWVEGIEKLEEREFI